MSGLGTHMGCGKARFKSLLVIIKAMILSRWSQKTWIWIKSIKCLPKPSEMSPNQVVLQTCAQGHTTTQVWSIRPSISSSTDSPNLRSIVTPCARLQYLEWVAEPSPTGQELLLWGESRLILQHLSTSLFLWHIVFQHLSHGMYLKIPWQNRNPSCSFNSSELFHVQYKDLVLHSLTMKAFTAMQSGCNILLFWSGRFFSLTLHRCTWWYQVQDMAELGPTHQINASIAKEIWLVCFNCIYRPRTSVDLRIQGIFRRHVHFTVVNVSQHRLKCLFTGNHFTYRNIYLSIFWHEGTEHGFKVTGKRKGNQWNTERLYITTRKVPQTDVLFSTVQRLHAVSTYSYFPATMRREKLPINAPSAIVCSVVVTILSHNIKETRWVR